MDSWHIFAYGLFAVKLLPGLNPDPIPEAASRGGNVNDESYPLNHGEMRHVWETCGLCTLSFGVENESLSCKQGSNAGSVVVSVILIWKASVCISFGDENGCSLLVFAWESLESVAGSS